MSPVIGQAERACWQRRAAAELARILDGHPELPCIAWTVGPVGSVVVGRVSGLARAVAVLARAQQDAVWERVHAQNKLRSHLREYFPGFLAAFGSVRGGITRPEARVILAAAPTPADAGRLTRARLASLLRKAGRQRGIETEAARLHAVFQQEQMRQLPLVEQAMGRQALALLRQLEAACQSADDLQQAAEESFSQHPDAGIIISFPGIGALTGARVLAEIGDDRSRFKDARGLKAYAGAAPISFCFRGHRASYP